MTDLKWQNPKSGWRIDRVIKYIPCYFVRPINRKSNFNLHTIRRGMKTWAALSLHPIHRRTARLSPPATGLFQLSDPRSVLSFYPRQYNLQITLSRLVLCPRQFC